MKRLCILMFVCTFVFWSIDCAVAQAGKESSKRTDKPEKSTAAGRSTQETADDANTPTDANATAQEPNTPKWKFPEVTDAMKKVDKQSRKELQKWRSLKAENSVELLNAIQEQVAAELNAVRQFAVEEDAAKTTEAIDRLLESRKKRLGKVVRKLEREEAKLRTREERTRGRGERTRSRSDRRSRESGRTRTRRETGTQEESTTTDTDTKK